MNLEGDNDQMQYIAATIPGAGLLILPNTSHFAFLQQPAPTSGVMVRTARPQYLWKQP
jgi:pimeloyl-ACP methyl ester carboxylesterase